MIKPSLFMSGGTCHVCVVSRDTEEKFEDLGVGNKNELVMNY